MDLGEVDVVVHLEVAEALWRVGREKLLLKSLLMCDSEVKWCEVGVVNNLQYGSAYLINTCSFKWKWKALGPGVERMEGFCVV